MSTAAERAPRPGDPIPVGSAGVPAGALGMALFLATEAMFFAGLISAFLVVRSQAVVWPPMGQPRLPVLVTGLNTAVLLLSGYTMLRAVRATRAGGSAVFPWLAWTAFLGSVFLLVQGYEWARLVGYGLSASRTVYGGTFYTLIGAHGVHVLAALITLAVITLRTRGLGVAGGGAARSAGLPGAARLRVALGGAYWLFVVAVWPVLYVLVYQPWVR